MDIGKHTRVFAVLILPSKMKSIDHEAFKGFRGMSVKVTCVFLGHDTVVKADRYNSFNEVERIYCLPGSNIQQFARQHNIPIKPLSEFRMEEHQ